MPVHQNTLTTSRDNTLSRRQALVSTAACGALALPVALLAAAPVVAGISTGADPHIALWAEHRGVVAEIGDDQYGAAPDELYRRKWELEEQIAQTPPTTPEGMAIVATVLLMWHGEVTYHEVDQHAGATLARHILAATPPDVLARAGLEG